MDEIFRALFGLTREAKEDAASEMPRRDFLKRFAAASAATGLAGADLNAEAQQSANTTPALPQIHGTPFNGIQMGPHTMLDEGIEHCLDFIQETAAINCLMVYSTTYHGDIRKPTRDLATDHGVPVRELQGRKLPNVWVKTHEQYYKNTTLRYPTIDSSYEFADRDLFAELAEPCKKRGMKLYARILEGSSRQITNFSKIVTVDTNGRPTGTACWSNPDYRNFFAATVEDLFRTYDLDGFQWGSERMGPLMNVILPWNNNPPTCFCEHCNARGKAAGVDPERAKKGFTELYNYVRALAATQPKPADGVFTGFVRLLLRYPEILGWEYQYRLGRESVMRTMYETIKAIKPSADVGWHVDHQPSSWDLVYRAEMSYAEMAPYSDYIKIIAYHDVLGGRIRSWYLDRFKRTILGELSLEDSLNLYYDFFNYDQNVEPKVNELSRKGMGPDYVFRETQHSVASAAGKTRIITGVGFDVPGSPAADPQKVYEAVIKSFEAGAAGILVSREYEEMKRPNLEAVGRAIRELTRH